MALLESTAIGMGTKARDFSLPGTDDQTYSLASFANAKVLVIIFMCNHCPYVKAVLERLNALAEEFRDRDVQFVGISANDAENYPEDSFAEMKKLPLAFPYLHDESQEVAKMYGAVCTPDIFVYDENHELTYHGRIDDNWKDEIAVTKRELAEALEETLAGEKIPSEEQKPSMGCSIKWR